MGTTIPNIQLIAVPTGSNIAAIQPANTTMIFDNIVFVNSTATRVAGFHHVVDSGSAPSPAAASPPASPPTATAASGPTAASPATNSGQFNRERFFTEYRDRFGSLNQGQVDGLEQLVGALESDAEVTDIQVIAYMLATVKHETANTFQPITEFGSQSYFNRYDPVLADTEARRNTARQMGNTEEGDGYKYRGRGYVQITWKNNYQKLGDAIGRDLVSEPDLALEPEIAYKIMSYGMRNGSFTGKKIGDFISTGNANYYDARQVINGHDQATLIQGYAEQFEQILRGSTA